MKRKTRGFGFGAKRDSERKRDELGKKAPTSETEWGSGKLAGRLDARRRTTDIAAKYITSKFYRPFAVSPLQARTQGVVRQDVDNCSSEDRSKTDAAPEAHASRPAGDVSPGKNHHDLPDGGISSVADYVTAIQVNWQQGVDAFMSIARLCAEASARLTALQKRELIQALPFGDSAFSKFVQIGTDTRLYAPDIQRLLPPHYTTVYAVTLLTDEELKRAVVEKVLHPDMQRAQLEKWHRELSRKVELARSPKEAASDTEAVGLPIASTQDAVESGALPSTMSDDNRNKELAVVPEDAPPEAAATAPAGPLPPARSDEEIPAFLDRRPLSAEDQRAFDAIMAAYNIASPVVRERVRAEIIRENTSSRSAADPIHCSRCDDHAATSNTTPNQPTMSEPLAQTADAADAAKAEKYELPKATTVIPHAADAPDAGIKNQSVEFVFHRVIGGRRIEVLRHRRRGKAGNENVGAA